MNSWVSSTTAVLCDATLWWRRTIMDPAFFSWQGGFMTAKCRRPIYTAGDTKRGVQSKYWNRLNQTLPLVYDFIVKKRLLIRAIFKVFDVSWLLCYPNFTDLEADALTTRPFRAFYHWISIEIYCPLQCLALLNTDHPAICAFVPW